MHLSIVIPTFQRHKKLKRCIDSILCQTHQDFKIYVMCDNNDVESFEYIETEYKGIDKVFPIIILDHQYVMGCWNLFTRDSQGNENIKDAMLGLCDDVELYPECLENAVKCFKENYKDTNGIVGLSQVCPGHSEYTYKPFGQTLIGKQFIERYPDRQIACPDYTFLYQDEEMFEYASSLNKFIHCKDAILKHYHPGFCREEMDETHKVSRGDTKNKDILTHLKRKSQGLIWGKSWELINEKEKT